MPRGGKRPGAGRKKGYKEKQTLERLAHEALIREMVARELGPMTEAQISKAKGYKYLVARNKRGGEFKRIAEADADAKLADPEQTIEVWERDPDAKAYLGLLDRAYGRPNERIQADVTIDAGPRIAMILARRKRGGNGHG